MELANIEKLLQKYLDAETTIAEENELKAYFTSNKVAPHLEEYKALFRYFSISKNEKLSKPIQLKTKKKHWKWISVAASIIVLISVYTGYQNNEQKKAEKIYNETRFALGMLSENLNKGNTAIAQLQYFEDATSKVFKQPKK
jgi:anti-sigma-K factor RskA